MRAVTVSTPFDGLGVPEVDRIEYDLWELRITLRFEARKAPVYAVFSRPAGFRVLDEGQLTAFWEPADRAAGWLWRLKAGGWLDLECSREGFIPELAAPEEYLIIGMNDCVSVLCHGAPKVYRA